VLQGGGVSGYSGRCRGMSIIYKTHSDGRVQAQYSQGHIAPKEAEGWGDGAEEALLNLFRSHDAGGDSLTTWEFSVWISFIHTADGVIKVRKNETGPRQICTHCKHVSTVGSPVIKTLCNATRGHPRVIKNIKEEDLHVGIHTPSWCPVIASKSESESIKGLVKFLQEVITTADELGVLLDQVYPTSKKNKSTTDLISIAQLHRHDMAKKMEKWYQLLDARREE